MRELRFSIHSNFVSYVSFFKIWAYITLVDLKLIYEYKRMFANLHYRITVFLQ